VSKETHRVIDVESALRKLPTAQRRSVARRHVLEQEFSAIGRRYDKKDAAVRQLCVQGLRKMEASLVREVLGDHPALQFLVTFYEWSHTPEPNGDLFVQATARTASALLISAADVRQRHAHLMMEAAAAARRLELHRRRAEWRLIVSRYGRAIRSAAPSIDLQSQYAEFEAMQRILSRLPR
jgi:hypothetical protein